MRTRLLIATMLCAGFLAVRCEAGNLLTIRLIEASNSGTGSPSGLNDVAASLRDSFGFDSCRLLASHVLTLPASKQTRQLGEYQVLCTGTQRGLGIEVSRGGKRLLKTNASLQDGKPLIVGGFPSGAGKQVLVFLAQ